MSPNQSSSNASRIGRNLPPNPDRGPTAPPPGKYRSNVDRFPEDFPRGPWPSMRVEKAPIYCAVDNRDGHQCFKTPLSIDRKVALANLLRDLNYSQMEIGYPSSNSTEFNAVRELITQKHLGSAIPQVLTLASRAHIDTTLDSLKGASAAIVHVYHTTARHFQERKNMTMDDIIRKTTDAIQHLKRRSHMFDGEIFLQVSADSFQDTSLQHALRFYRACIETWKPTPENQMIVNIPNTVEREDPHFFANKVHYISERFKEWERRDSVIVSVHTHDDCGSSVQAARMSVATGAADRVEGTEFGHGERSGNVSLSTFTGRLYIDGIDPEVYLPTPNEVRRYEEIMGVTRRQVGRKSWKIRHPEQMISERAPFVGPETRTVSTGVHADTTYHEFEKVKGDSTSPMNLTHLAYDPRDWGDSIRFQATSQQGATGMAPTCEQECGIRMPEWMRPEFYPPANAAAVARGTALTKKELYKVFTSTFVQPSGAFQVVNPLIRKNSKGSECRVSMGVRVNGHDPVDTAGEGSSIEEAVKEAVGVMGVSIVDVNSTLQYLGTGASERAVVCAQVIVKGRTTSGVGISTDPDAARVDAIVSALNRGCNADEVRSAM